MYHILICDDDEEYRSSVYRAAKQAMQALVTDCVIVSTGDPASLSPETLAQCSFALLDVDLQTPNSTGMTLARRIRRYNADALIIFVTHYIEYALEGYEVDTFRYILKSDMDSKLPTALRDGLDRIKARQRTLAFSLNGEETCIPLRYIEYIESQKHMVLVRLSPNAPNSQKELRFYAAISDLEKKLTAQDFVRTHRCFLVNLQHVKSVKYRQVMLKSGESLPLGENRYQPVKQAHMLFRGR